MSPGRAYVFLDRDGTLVRDPGYVHRIEDYALLPGVVTGLRRLVAAGFGLAIVTNQSGIGRGLFAAADFERFQDHLLRDLTRRGVPVAGSYHCPHVPDAGCPCRKPAPGMLLRAREELGADLARSWLIGDGEADVGAARAAGLAGCVRLRPAASRAAPPPGPTPAGAGGDGRAGEAPDVLAAADHILARAVAGARPQSAP